MKKRKNKKTGRLPVPPTSAKLDRAKRKVEILPPGTFSQREWAKRLNDLWHGIRSNAVEGFIQLGRELITARGKFGEWGSGYERWGTWCEAELEFGYQVANILAGIARWVEERQIYSIAIKLLPPDYTTLRAITRLPHETFLALVEDGTICPTLKRNEISKILRLQRVRADERRILNLVPIEGKFRTLVFDPAWEYDWLSLAGRAKPGYAMQTLDQLRALDIKQWAEPECHLYVWTTNNFMYEACKLVELWGFQHRVVLTWIKPPPFGLGSYFRNSTEHVLFATLGETTTRPAASSIPTHFEAPRGKHSEKPEKFYEIVRAASYPPYGEGNQIAKREDFTNLFKEVEKAA